MKSISLYEDKKTKIHSIDPLSKLLYILTAIAIPILLGSKIATLVFIGLSLSSLTIGKVLKKTLPIMGFSTIVLLSIVIIQGMFRAENITPIWGIGPITFYKEGLLFALGIGLSVINILLSFAILVLTTKPSDLVEALVRMGLSPRLGYVLSSVFQIIPQMTATMETITDAQRSRGMETEGKLVTRIKAFFPLISPVVMNSLITTKERAIALEVRGFNAKQKRTFFNEAKESNLDKAIKIILMGLIVLSFGWRVLLWLK